MEIGIACHLAAHVLDALGQLGILHISRVIENVPRLGDSGLFGDHPGVQRAADVAQRVQGVHRAHTPARDPDQPHHLPLELVESHQVESVLQHAARAAVVLGCGEDDALGGAYLIAKLPDTRRVAAFVLLAVAEVESVFAQVD